MGTMAKTEVEAERTVWSGRPSFWNWWPTFAAADLSLLLAGALWWTGRPDYAPYALGAAAVFYLLVVFLRFSSSYRLTTHRAMARTGLLAAHLDEVEIRDVRSITLDQSLFQRLLGIGDVGFSTSGGDGVEVAFHGIADAVAIKEKVRLARLTHEKAHER